MPVPRAASSAPKRNVYGQREREHYGFTGVRESVEWVAMRSGYDEDCDGWELIRWRGAVASAIRGKRGQQLLREMADALDAMPNKRLIADELEDRSSGDVCAIGSVGRCRGINMGQLDPYEPKSIANAFGVAPALVMEIAHVNDEWISGQQSPEKRWATVRRWVSEQLQGCR